MSIDIAGPVPALVTKALNATTLRHEVIANNIANINTDGYRPLRVSFEDQLAGILSAENIGDDALLAAQLKTVEPRVYETDVASGVNQLDIEMISMAKNTLHYQTLLTGVKNYMSIMKMAIKEGKV